jgi:hypothetical protein
MMHALIYLYRFARKTKGRYASAKRVVRFLTKGY